MSLSDLASLGSFVSGVAVLISLVFLYFQLRQVNQQVRQAERNQRATIASLRASRTVEVMLRNTDPSMAMAYGKAVGGDVDITATELQQFLAYFRAFLTNTEDTFLQAHHGLLEGATHRAYVTSMAATMASPAYRLAWRLMRNVVGGPEYAEFIDEIIAKTPMRPFGSPQDRLSDWRSGWVELTPTA
jgi:hypothetical protein